MEGFIHLGDSDTAMATVGDLEILISAVGMIHSGILFILTGDLGVLGGTDGVAAGLTMVGSVTDSVGDGIILITDTGTILTDLMQIKEMLLTADLPEIPDLLIEMLKAEEIHILKEYEKSGVQEIPIMVLRELEIA